MTQMRSGLGTYLQGGVERLDSGFVFTEGPVWHPDGFLLFSDMPGDVRRRWDPVNGVSVARQPANKCNGMAYDAVGRLLVCEHSTSRLVCERADGSSETMASRFDGKQLNSPNDVIVAFNGDIYFSDPTYGRTADFGVEREAELGFQGVYRLPGRGGELELVDDDFMQPNGLCLSPDESVLYVNDTERAHIVAYPRNADGTLGTRRVFADGVGDVDYEIGVVDGMKCDSEGNVLVTGPRGIWVFDRDGAHLGVIDVPEVVGNFNWGGEDWSSLYITASTSVYRMEAEVSGAPVPNMRREVSDA